MSKLSTPITETILVVNTQSFAGLSQIRPHAAGLDIGAHEIWVCVPGEEVDTQIVRLFGTYTADLLRHRAQLLQHRAPHIQHMQKALLQMNIQLSQALSDVTGETGQAIIRSIVAGERNPFQLAALRNYRCQKDEAEIAKALTGTWRNEHLFVLQQALELYDFYTAQIQACDAEIERTYALIRPDWPSEGPDEFPKKKNRSHSINAPKNEEDIQRNLLRIARVDLAAVDGLSVSLAQTILSEIGTDMSKWPSEKHFCSWLGLAPKNDITGGKTIRSRTYKTKNRAGQAFRLAASSVTRADCAFGAFYRRKKSQIGPAQAVVATAHMMARTVYFMLKNQVSYVQISATSFDQRYREQQIRYLHRKAAKLGFQLIPILTSPLTVS